MASPLLNVMLAAARKAGRALIRDFGEVEQLQVSRKGPADFVSVADEKAERIVRQELQKARPAYGLMMEEGGVVQGADTSHVWIVDPLDGTTNFLHGIPHFAISLALERNAEIVCAVVFNPATDEAFVAEKGAGAFLNGRRLRVAARRELRDCLVATGIPYHGRPGHKEFLGSLEAVMGEVAGLRRFGCASLDLAWVAAGRYDAFFERGLDPWDIAAGLLLVQEAGGLTSDLRGRNRMLKTGEVLAANAELHGPLLKLVSRAAPAPAPALAGTPA
jgi:myo-inositol-1(or 4)-monophosphatase